MQGVWEPPLYRPAGVVAYYLTRRVARFLNILGIDPMNSNDPGCISLAIIADKANSILPAQLMTANRPDGTVITRFIKRALLLKKPVSDVSELSV